MTKIFRYFKSTGCNVVDIVSILVDESDSMQLEIFMLCKSNRLILMTFCVLPNNELSKSRRTVLLMSYCLNLRYV